VRNLFRALRGKPVELSAKQQEKMARMQARADAQAAAAEAAGRQARDEYARFADERGLTVREAPTSLRDALDHARSELGGMFDDRRDVLDPGPGADLSRPPAEIEDERERATVTAAERAERDAARAPYRAPGAAPVAFTRVPATGADQLTAVAAVLARTDPAAVFGVFRVPDRFDLSRASERKAYVEWEIAHAPGAVGAAAGPVVESVLGREEHLVLRRPGEPSVLDEDVIGAAIARAGLQPEDTFGLSRLLAFAGHQFEHGMSIQAHVIGVMLLARTRVSGPAAPQPVLEPAPFHVERLDWEAVAAWNAPWRYGPPRTPAPLPHLPATWRELLEAYLEVVGVQPGDSFGVQVTRSAEGNLNDLSLASFRKNFSRPKLPCADGTPRARLQAGEHVVLTYRDRPEYAEGRERWRAYQRDVLRARLDHLTHAPRPPIAEDLRPRTSLAEDVFDFLNPLDPGTPLPGLANRGGRSLGPYCGVSEL
jgi:hypothetical protein